MALAFADELLADPALLAAYARTFGEEDDATLAIFAPDGDADAIAEALGPRADVGADLLLLAVPGDREDEVAAQVDCLYSRRLPTGAFRSLVRVDDSRAHHLRAIAEDRWSGGARPDRAAMPGPAPADEDPYARRLRQETARYEHVETVHDLPKIYHYWSKRYAHPKLRAVGVESINGFFAARIAAASQRLGRPARVFSLGAGNCDLELKLAESVRALGSGAEFDCVELNPTMLERGRAEAGRRGFGDSFRFVEADINTWTPGRDYDVCVVSHALHHFVELEHILDAVRDALAPDGSLLVSDMIGRNGHARWPEALEAVRRLWAEAPDRYKHHRQLGRVEPEFLDWDCSVDGFEGIRAQDILPLLLERFSFETFAAFGNVIDPFVDRGFGPNLDPELAEDRAFIDRAASIDDALTDLGIVKPTKMVAELRVGPVAETRTYRHWTPEFCLRDPGAPAPAVPPFDDVLRAAASAPASGPALAVVLLDDARGRLAPGSFVEVPACELPPGIHDRLAAAADPVARTMKREWDERARENAMHYIASGRDEWDADEFFANGAASVRTYVVAELDLLCAGRDPRGLRALDIGCGVGRLTRALADVFGEVHGVDVSGEMIARGRELLADVPNAHLHETSGVDLARFGDASLDFAFSFIVFQHIPSREAVVSYFREAHRVLTPGSFFKFQVQGTRDPHYLEAEKDTWLGVSFSERELRELAGEIGFEVVRGEGAGTQYFWQWWRKP